MAILIHPTQWDIAFAEHAAHWRGHVAAHRIGTPPAPSLAAASLAAADALFRARATRRAEAAR